MVRSPADVVTSLKNYSSEELHSSTSRLTCQFTILSASLLNSVHQPQEQPLHTLSSIIGQTWKEDLSMSQTPCQEKLSQRYVGLRVSMWSSQISETTATCKFGGRLLSHFFFLAHIFYVL